MAERKTQQLNISMDKETFRALSAYAEKEGRTISNAISFMVNLALKNAN